MASEESKARDRKLAEEALFKARGAESAQAETDMYKCGKCRGRKCTYFQMQTSADEPMTTFVTCVNCGNHWKVHFGVFLILILKKLIFFSVKISFAEQEKRRINLFINTLLFVL
jgi:hypothetical protein